MLLIFPFSLFEMPTLTEAEASQALKSLLSDLGVVRGETIYLGIDMARIPLPHWPVELNRAAIRAREDRWCAFIFEQIMDVLGPSGTMLVGTFSYSCSNPAVPFVLEETPSEIGPFTNWFRQQSQAIRSLHPIFSVAGIGPLASEILTNVGGAAFGPCSPFGRLSGSDVRFVSLGVPFHLSITYLHHLEQCYGCNHRYHKIFTTPVIKEGVIQKGPFLGYVRWRGLDAGSDFKLCETRMMAEGVLREVNWNDCVNQAVLARDVDRIGYAMLTENPCAFVSRDVQVDLNETITGANPVRDSVDVFKLLE